MTLEQESKMWEEARSRYSVKGRQLAFIEGAMWYNKVLKEEQDAEPINPFEDFDPVKELGDIIKDTFGKGKKPC